MASAADDDDPSSSLYWWDAFMLPDTDSMFHHSVREEKDELGSDADLFVPEATFGDREELLDLTKKELERVVNKLIDPAWKLRPGQFSSPSLEVEKKNTWSAACQPAGVKRW